METTDETNFPLSFGQWIRGWRIDKWYKLTILANDQVACVNYFKDKNVAIVLGPSYCTKYGNSKKLESVEVKTRDGEIGYVIKNGLATDEEIKLENPIETEERALNLIKAKMSETEMILLFQNFPLCGASQPIAPNWG